ncbi:MULTISPECIES: alpha/beta fold hydrolase [Mycobacteriaceae]|uniref:Alpha/beta fold hydrolase n=2 Tax=Mycobacteriaceae TaxID=1762 RepID=A0ACC6MKN0_MYCPF|nr:MULTISPECIES: alpha/beta fold hydrolase [Mycobacteriaceae]MDZ5087412.1 alpha/beta fold hydrolase [Mycolicibacterium parafortuitum]
MSTTSRAPGHHSGQTGCAADGSTDDRVVERDLRGGAGDCTGATAASDRRRLHGRALGMDILAVMSSSAATGILGFAFWTAAARGYDAAEVGRASAILSSATLIAILANFSLGNLYERFLPLAGRDTHRLVRHGTTFALGAAVLFGVVFVLVGPRDELFPHPVEMALFPVAVAVLSVYALQDQVLVGLGRARMIATKNIGQSTTKLVAVIALIPVATGAAIVWSWVLPAAVITGVIAVVVIRRESRRRAGQPALPPRRELFHFFASSYAINSVDVTVPLLVPLIVVAQLGTEMNAYFSMCWLVVNTLGVLIGATAAPFIATASTPGADLRSCTRRFVVMCGGAAVASCLGLLVAAPLILGILGPQYADEGTRLIRLMALTLPALAVMTIYTALARLQRRLRLAVTSQVVLGVVVVAGSILSTPRWGIDGVGYTYLFAEFVCTAILLGPTIALVRRFGSTSTPPPAEPSAAPTPAHRRPAGPDVTGEGPLAYQSVTERFREVAERLSGRVALRSGSDSVTYAELRAAAERWTAQLRSRDDPDAAVALVGDLSADTAAVILGSFAAPAPLVPLDTSLPHDRMQQLVEVLRARGVALDTVVVGGGTPTLSPDAIGGTQVWRAGRELPPLARPVESATLSVDTVTSIQFTSGSSGAPKAVVHVHGTWLSDWILHRDRFGIVEGTRVALCMPVSFAAGLNVAIGALLSGAEIIALDPRAHTADDVVRRLGDAEVVMCTPSFLQSLSEAADANPPLDRIRRIVTTGEPLYSNVVAGARRVAPNAVLTNWAGSSETLGIAHYDIGPDDEVPAGVVPAGIAVPHKTLGVDEDGRLTVTSRYLAAGYLDPRSAATTFVQNSDGSATFVTNDRARITETGTLVILGRMDAAVKIRGYLVEPAEVETALLECRGIREALVIAGGDSDAPVLIGYAAPTPGTRTPAVADIRAQLHSRLPAWMVPTHIVLVEALPRTERGKVSRQDLPAPQRGPLEPPHPGLETDIAAEWAAILRLDAVGRNENFVALGGDSLNVAQLTAALARRYGVTLSPSELASAPTVAQLAERLETCLRRGTTATAARPAPTTVVLRSPSAHTRRTLFCFAGAGASALTFAPLAEHVGADTAVVAYQAQGLENRAVPDWTVGRAAGRHLRELLAVQSEGPYTLVGHSLGAFIATEVANRLTELGHRVDLVAMLDPFLPPRTIRAARQFLPDVTSALLEQAPIPRSVLWRRRLWLPLAGIAGSRPERRIEALREVGVRVGRLHRPRPYDGPTLLVLSTFNSDDARVWPHLLTGRLQIERINCDHDSVIREPHIRRVGELIAAARVQC